MNGGTIMKNMARYITMILLVLTSIITATAQDIRLPDDPGHPVSHHQLKIVSTEAFNIIIGVYNHNDNGSWFTTWSAYTNITQRDANISLTLDEGDSIKIWNSTYTWSGWQYTYMTMDGKKIHENQHLESYSDSDMPTIIMPDHDATIEVYATFDPSTPGVEQADNPYCGMWNAETGELFVNNFVPYVPGYQSGYYGMGKGGYLLVGAINQAVYDYNISKADVRILTVSGEMGSGYENIAFENTHTIDLRHTYGYKSYSGLWYDNKTWYDNIFDQSVYSSSLRHLILPSNIQGISDGAFEGWDGEWKLEELTCYAVTPPMVNDETLNRLPTTCVLSVPEQSVAAYKADKHWSRFKTIKGILEAEDVTVDLPDNFTDGRYRGMSLELLNAENGESRKYVVDERGQYVYRGLVSGVRYSALLRSPKNGIIAQTDTMLLDNQPIEMTFPKVVGMDEVLLTVKADGQDVTADVTISWTDRKGNRLGEGSRLEQQIEGSHVYYAIKLPSQLATLYQQPPTTEHIVGTNNSIDVTLQSLDSVSVSGVVRDADGNRIGGATVVIAQTVNGQISKSFVTTTDVSGRFALKALAGPVARSISATGYITNRRELKLDSSTQTDTVTLAPLSGAVITYGFTYTESVLKGETASTSPSYSDYQNVAITTYNETTGKELTDISVQHPQVVVLSGAKKGDRIRLTATSMADAFKPVTLAATLDNDETASVTLPIVQYGGIEASFQQTDNSAVTASLYDASGKLYQTYDYDEATIRMTEIPDGSYTLVTMGGSTLFSRILSLSDYAAVGLKEGTDYVKNEVTVKSGEIVTVSNSTIPVPGESSHYYTDESATTFAVSKSEVSVGNNVTLRATLGFRPAYRGKVSDVSLVVSLPSNGQMVEGSAMTGTRLTRSTVSDNRVTIPISIDELDQNTRFAVATTAEGNFTPTAYVQFKVDGREVLQPIGTVSCDVKGMTISVPETICDLTLPVQGTAPSRSFITIYAGNTEVGQTTTRDDGTWISYVELPSYPNLSKIPVRCKMTTRQGLEFHSQTATTTYDQSYVQVEHVYMWYEGQFIDFDFNHPDRIEEQSYGTGMSDMYTFAVEFNTSDSTKVVNPALFVKMTNGEWDTVENLTYNKDKGWWMGTYQLWHGEGICNVDVDYQQGNHIVRLDADALVGVENILAINQDDIALLEKEVRWLLQDIDKESAPNVRHQLIVKMMEMSGINPESIDWNNIPDITIDEALDRAERYLQQYNRIAEGFSTTSLYDLDFGENMKITRTSGLTVEQLQSEGYNEVLTTGDFSCFELIQDGRYVFVDLKQNIRIEVTGEQAAQMARMRAGFAGDVWEWFHSTESTLLDWLTKFSTGVDILKNNIDNIRKVMVPMVVNMEKELQTLAILYNNPALHMTSLQMERYATLQWQAPLMRCVSDFLHWLKQYGIDPGKSAEIFARVPGASSPAAAAAKKSLEFMKKLGSAMTWVAIANDLYDGITKTKRVVEIYAAIPNPCKDDEENAYKLRDDVINFAMEVSIYYTLLTAADIASNETTLAGVLGIPASAGASVVAVMGGVTATLIKMVANWAYGMRYEDNMQLLNRRLFALACDRKEEEKKILAQKRMEKRFARNRDLTVLIDPSGFIYEGVTDNRMENATTTIYYKWEGEDEYGDLHNEAVKWDAAAYGQQNPLLTDAEGKYQWDVPKGLWQVKVEKDGYETAYSEWLPVPPPQLDVNIGIVQKAIPEVKTARAYEDGIEVEFNKYMRPATLTTANLWLTQGSGQVPCTIETLNASKNWEGDATYVSRILLRPSSQLTVGEKIGLFVRRQVESYAGIEMQNDYEQEFTVVSEIRSLKVDPRIDVNQNGERTFVVTASPAAAANGKTLQATWELDGFMSLNASAVFNADGQALFTAQGMLPGEVAVKFSMDETSATVQTNIRVLGSAEKDIIAAPTASRISGTSVNNGDVVELYCSTEGTQIWYTTDGTCPCDENGTRQLYTSPILITKDMELKAYAVRGDEVSEVSTFTYYLATGIPANVTTGKVPVAYYSPNGQRLLHPQKGINIVQYEDGTIRKIIIK